MSEKGRNITRPLRLSAFCSLVALFLSCSVSAQQEPRRYWIQFIDKHHSPYSLDRPEEFLSPASLERRYIQGIPLAENDLPVSPLYIDSVQAVGNAPVVNRSRWFNAVTLELTDTTVIDALLALPFVRRIEVVRKNREGIRFEPLPFSHNAARHWHISVDSPYGAAYRQIAMLNGHRLHSLGFEGKGVAIAVMDAGFPNLTSMVAFSMLYAEGRIKGTYDFVDVEPNVLNNTHYHGTVVLSCMAAYLPGQYVGTAPAADYWLFVTEDVAGESPAEEDNWIAAAEYADSVGAKIFNTSLSYTVFDDPAFNYTYSDLDGRTTRISRAAAVAASKGIICVNSAGNSGASSWQHIGAPADADSTLAVGAVDSLGAYAPFSSRGPSADGRVKPDIAAQGARALAVWPDGELVRANGTSFSAPITAGLVACLWQAHLDKTNLEIMDAIRRSASQYAHPDDRLGYGIPDFYKAHLLLSDQVDAPSEMLIYVYPNPYTDRLYLEYYSPEAQDIAYTLSDVGGRKIYEGKIQVYGGTTSVIRITDDPGLPGGVYFLQLRGKALQRTLKVVKQ